MDVYSVLAALRENTPLDAQGTADALPLCRTAARRVERLVRGGVSPDDERLTALAAADVWRRLLLQSAAREDTAVSFRAGDVSVTQNTARLLEAAQAFYQTAEADAASLLRDDGFFFRGVRL